MKILHLARKNCRSLKCTRCGFRQTEFKTASKHDWTQKTHIWLNHDYDEKVTRCDDPIVSIIMVMEDES